mgnify:FL=1
MKKLLSILLTVLLVVSLIGCGSKEQEASADEVTEETTETTGTELPNPVEETDAAGIMEKLGFEFGIPEGAQDISYHIISGEIAEMTFTDEAGTKFTARIKSGGTEIEDISGLYYEWTHEESTQIGRCEGVAKSFVGENENDVQAILWLDIVPGIMYSISAEGPDLNGLDLEVIALQVYIETQGEV